MIRAPTPAERQVQHSLVQWLRAVLPVGSLVAAVENERASAVQFRSDMTPSERRKVALAQARFQEKRKASGVLPGFPDLVCLLPAGRTILLEVKRERGGEVSLAQDGLHPRIRSLGHAVAVVTGIESARHELRLMGVPLREAAGQPEVKARVRVQKGRLPADPVPF